MSKIDECLQGVHGARSEAPWPEKVGVADLHALCRATPRLYLILKSDLTIVDASDAYLRATLLWREEIRGCRLFDVFPDNPHDVTADGVQNLRASLHQVLQRGKPHRMALQRYDVCDHVAGDGAWVEKFWAPMNTPVFGSGSREITHVLHQVEDMTQAVFLRQSLAEQALVLAEQRATLDRMRQDLLRRQREVRADQQSLAAMLQEGEPAGASLEALQGHLGGPDMRWYWGPGHGAPVAGIYTSFHQRACGGLGPSMVYMQAGRAFPRCPRCQDGVLYRLMRPSL